MYVCVFFVCFQVLAVYYRTAASSDQYEMGGSDDVGFEKYSFKADNTG